LIYIELPNSIVKNFVGETAMTEYTNQLMLFKELSDKKVQADFNGGQITSDAGVLLLRETESKLGLCKRMALALRDRRHASYVQHVLSQLLTQRVFQIICGYEDANDCNELRLDPLFKLGCEILPGSTDLLASQPTMSRFENAPSYTDLYRMGCGLVDAFCDSYTKPPEAIVLDIDDTDDPTYGDQQLSLFNAHYDTWCYQPLHVFEGSSGKLISSILRPGKRPTGQQIASILEHIVKRIKKHWPQVQILLRGDSHFCCPDTLALCEEYNIKFVLGLSGNSVLLRMADSLMAKARELFEASGEPVKIYSEFFYQAGTWDNPYRVIVKAEYNEKGANTRFIATNLLSAHRPFVYENIYCARGAMELMIKELKNHLFSDRTSCSSFHANQFRLFLHSMAYIILHALREKYLAGTELAQAEFSTIRLKLIKVGARVIQMTTKIKIHLASGCPSKHLFYHIYLQACSP